MLQHRRSWHRVRLVLEADDAQEVFQSNRSHCLDVAVRIRVGVQLLKDGVQAERNGGAPARAFARTCAARTLFLANVY
jgi:hypothetical protein